jgi:SAM-dependent methyltransferase
VKGWTCPGCGHRDGRILFRARDRLYRTTTRTFSVVECDACRLMSLHPRPEPSELKQYYPENYWFVPEENAAARIEERYRRFVLRDHVNFVRRAIEDAGEPGPVLDVGSGGGLFLRMLQERGARVAGLDFSARAAALAWRVNGVPSVCADLSRSPLAPGSCAAVTMFHVLEHLHAPEEYLQRAFELLRPDGRLIVQVPNAACWQFLLLGENWSGIDVPRHLVDFRASDLERLLAACGFEMLRRKHFSLRDNPAGLATSLAPWLDPMARRVRRVKESASARLVKDLVYFAILLAETPFTTLEDACRAGSTIMIEARKQRGKP